MNKFHIFFFLLSLNLSTLPDKKSKISLRTKYIEEGIYNLVLQKRLSVLTYLSGLRTSREKYGYFRLNFKLTFANKNDNKYFNILHVYSGLYIGVKKEPNIITDNDNLKIDVSDKIITDAENPYVNYEWEFVKIKGKDNYYTIKNKLGCALNEIRSKFFCSFNEEGTIFTLVKIYEEKEKMLSEEEKKILDEEPIDVFIKYIDIHDPNLLRNNLTQIDKDNENGELRYCVRSILKNIPWIRKIFILMPNEKVRFFKNYSEINEKIIYIHDKDLLGHDSANIHAFQFRIWKLKEFGLSENFISMDDDYFIGKPMEKCDFFYVENGTVFPYIINTNFFVHTMKSVETDIQNSLKKLEINKRNQTSDEFTYTVFRTYLFLIQYFNSLIKVPYFTHNAIPVKSSDLKELFDLVDNSSEFRYPTLYSLYRHPQSLQYQTAYVVYVFNKYKRKVNKIYYNYIDAANTLTANFDFPLFCINTGGNKDYTKFDFMKMKVTMEKLFPVPTKYEIYETKTLAENAFDVLKKMEEEHKLLMDEKKLDELEKEQFVNEKISDKFDKCNNQLGFLKAENLAYNIKNEKLNSDLDNCKKECNLKEKKLSELEKVNDDYHLIGEIKRELNIVNNDIFDYGKKIEEYQNENEEYLERIKKNKSTQKEMYFMISFQSIFIIAILIGLNHVFNKNSKEFNRFNDKNIS